jgi:Zn-dependent protease/CBS domain-containing protein
MFGKRINLFKLLGFQVRIDLSWIIIAVLIAWSLSMGFFPFRFRGLSTQTYWIMGIVGAIGFFLSIIVHEFCHSLVAREYGVRMRGITLFIFGGIAEMPEEPPSPKAEFMMAVVGPLSSILLAAIFYAMYSVGAFAGMSRPVSGVIQYLAFINGLLAVFNVIPAFPLDGGRILRSVLWGIKGNLQWATRIASWMGSGFGLLLILLGVLSLFAGNFIGGMWWFLIGLFLYNAARMSYQQVLTQKALEGASVSRFMKSDPISVTSDMTVSQLVENYVYVFHHKLYPVVSDYNKVEGCVTTRQIKEVPRPEWNEKRVGDILVPCSEDNTIAPDADAFKALALMSRTGTSRLMVTEGERLVGVVSLKDMLKYLSLHIELDTQ